MPDSALPDSDSNPTPISRCDLYEDIVVNDIILKVDRHYNAVFKGKIILVNDRGIQTGKYRDTELIYYGGRYYPTYNLTPSLGLRPDQILLPGEDHVTT